MTIKELRLLQALPLELKVRRTKQRIKEWVDEYGTDGVYVSFSGGKDSTVLLHIVREMFPSIPGVYVDTGLEYPELRQHVKTFDNIVWLKPKMNFKKVVTQYGYPFISKEVSKDLGIIRRWKNNPNPPTKPLPIARPGDPYYPYPYYKLMGWLTDKHGNKSQFNQDKWAFMMNCPYIIDSKCCDIMKKEPIHEYNKQSGRKPIVGIMAEESRMRTKKYLTQGCNAFNSAEPMSSPMGFWTESDVLQYIKENNIEICSVYGDIVEENGKYKTTGLNRTGCMFCAYGAQIKGDERFLLLKEKYPNQYNYIMKPVEEGGLGYKEVIDWINTNGKNVNIKY